MNNTSDQSCVWYILSTYSIKHETIVLNLLFLYFLWVLVISSISIFLSAHHALHRIVEAVEKHDRIRLKNALKLPYLHMRDIKDDFMEYYMERLVHTLNTHRVSINTIWKDLYTP